MTNHPRSHGGKLRKPKFVFKSSQIVWWKPERVPVIVLGYFDLGYNIRWGRGAFDVCWTADLNLRPLTKKEAGR